MLRQPEQRETKYQKNVNESKRTAESVGGAHAHVDRVERANSHRRRFASDNNKAKQNVESNKAVFSLPVRMHFGVDIATRGGVPGTNEPICARIANTAT